MSIDHPKLVDFCGINQDEGSCVLVIADDREWNDWEHLQALQKKLNNYLAFIESGEIYTARPAARGLEIEIAIRCKFVPEGEDDFSALRLARTAIEDAGFRFSVVTEMGRFEIPGG
ncbi:DUF6572 domain-containing protein [Luteolibacter sp. AS25]|uniref:DUF6572 domain-containing protein n=1 Tax=Luteolibacter sp. AS25 TaxID=3135776 RepID=UPI00398B5957